MDQMKEINGVVYERQVIKTRLFQFGDDIVSAVQEYVLPIKQQGDWFAISEKVVSVCQNNVRHISTVKVGFLAKCKNNCHESWYTD
jgi:F420-0:gamma-glutamyl ligase